MILDIRYTDKAPEQFQNVRRTTFHISKDEAFQPDMVVRFRDNTFTMISLETVYAVVVTND